MPNADATTQSTLRAKLEFGVMRKSFERAYRSWSHARDDLRSALLLRGPMLARAEAWLYEFPEKLTEGQKAFIGESIARNHAKNNQSMIQKVVESSTSGTFWFVVITFFLGMRLLAPNAIEIVTSVLTDPLTRRTTVASRPLPPLPTEEPAREPEKDDEEMPPPSAEDAAARAAANAERQVQRYASLAAKKIDERETRSALLLAIEVAQMAVNAPALEGVRDKTVSLASSLISQALASKIADGPVPMPAFKGPAALFCHRHDVVVTASQDGVVRAIRADTGTVVLELKEAGRTLQGATIDASCDRLLLPAEDHTAEIWSIAKGHRLAVLAGHESDVVATAFNDRRPLVATAGQDGRVRIWDAASGRLRADLEGHDGEATSLAFSPDGGRLASGGSDKTVRVWDLGRTKASAVFTGHAGTVTQLEFSPDGRSVLSVGVDGFAFVWDAATGAIIHRLRQPDGSIVSASYDPAGSRIAARTQDGRILLLDAGNGQPAVKLDTRPEQARSLTFSDDGRLLMVTSWDGSAGLWSAQTGRWLAGANRPNSRIESAAFAANGRQLVALAGDGTVFSAPLFDAPAEAVRYAQSIVGHCLTREEREQMGLADDMPAWCSSSIIER